jgi:hypothetical protein
VGQFEMKKYYIDNFNSLTNDATCFSIKCRGLSMLRVNQYAFYRLACVLHPLSEIKESVKLKDFHYPLLSSKSWLAFLLQNSLVPIVVSRQACVELKNAINSVLTPQEGENDIDLERELTWIEVYGITNSLSTFETVFSAELQTLDTYFVMQKLAYSTHDLIENGEKVFPADILLKLPSDIIEDVRQAGRCIAFELHTAAGYHIMRAAEKTLRIYYSLIMGKPTEMNWGPCVTELENSNKANSKVLGVFDQIRDIHRNPIMHPDIFLEQNESLTLFDIAKSAITVMMGEIIKQESLMNQTAIPLD